MDFRDNLLTVFGTANLRFGTTMFATLPVALFVLLFPHEARFGASLGALIVLFPISLSFILSARRSYGDKPESISIDIALLFLSVLLYDYLSQDYFRLGITFVVFLIIRQIHLLHYDLMNDSAKSILVKMLITIVLTIFITLSINLAIVLYALAKMS